MTKDQFIALMAMLRRVHAELEILNKTLERNERRKLKEKRQERSPFTRD